MSAAQLFRWMYRIERARGVGRFKAALYAVKYTFTPAPF